MAGESTEITQHQPYGRIRRLIVTWLSDDTTAATQTIGLSNIEGQLLTLTTVPNNSPTSNYDITLLDDQSVDVLQGLGADRHTSSTEQVLLVYSSTQVHPYVTRDQNLTLTIANNAATSAGGDIILTYIIP